MPRAGVSAQRVLFPSLFTMAPTVVDVKSVQLMPWTILAPVFLAGVCLVDIVMDLVCGRVAGLCACARVWL